MRTSLIVAGVLVLFVMIVWAVCVGVAALSKRACTAVLNAGGYIYGARAKDEREHSPHTLARAPTDAEYTFRPEQDPYLR
jgi:hypothetical protein